MSNPDDPNGREFDLKESKLERQKRKPSINPPQPFLRLVSPIRQEIGELSTQPLTVVSRNPAIGEPHVKNELGQRSRLRLVGRPDIIRELDLEVKLGRILDSLMRVGELEYKNGIYTVPQANSAGSKFYSIDPKKMLMEDNLDLSRIEDAWSNDMRVLELGLPLDSARLMNRLEKTLKSIQVGSNTAKFATHEGDNFKFNKAAILRAATANAAKRGVSLMLTSGESEAEERYKTLEHYLVEMKRLGFDCKNLTDIMLMMKQAFEAKGGEEVEIPLTYTVMCDPTIENNGFVPNVSCSEHDRKILFNAYPSTFAGHTYGVGRVMRIDKLQN